MQWTALALRHRSSIGWLRQSKPLGAGGQLLKLRVLVAAACHFACVAGVFLAWSLSAAAQDGILPPTTTATATNNPATDPEYNVLFKRMFSNPTDLAGDYFGMWLFGLEIWNAKSCPRVPCGAFPS